MQEMKEFFSAVLLATHRYTFSKWRSNSGFSYREHMNKGQNTATAKEKKADYYSSNLAGIFGIYFCQISQLPGLLAFVKVPFIRFLHFNHFHLHGSLCSD